MSSSTAWRRAAVAIGILGAAAATVVLGLVETRRRMEVESLHRLARAGRAPVSTATTAVLLDAIAARPGRAGFRVLLARLDSDPRGDRPRREWALAAAASPGLDDVWVAWAEANLSAWSGMSPADRSEAERGFGRALRSEDFALRDFARLFAAAGRERALALLPDDGAVLYAATASLAASGQTPEAQRLLPAAERSERRARAVELGDIERRRERGEGAHLESACRSWLDRHPLGQFDDSAARRELLRLLDAWPSTPGSWADDPRARLIRFFLDGRLDPAAASELEHTLVPLRDVPEGVRALIQLISRGAEADLLSPTGATPSPEWNPYLVERARRDAVMGRQTEALASLASLSDSERDGCDALLVRRSVFQALPHGEELESVEKRLDALRRPASAQRLGSGGVSVCLDGAEPPPEVDFVVAAGPPGLLAWGWNGGREGMLALSESATSFRVPTPDSTGGHRAWAAFAAGGLGREVHILLREPS